MIGGITFLSCQAYEWYHFIHGTEGGARLVEVSAMQDIPLPGIDATKQDKVKVFPVWSTKEENSESEIVGLRLSNGRLITDERVPAIWASGTPTTGGANLHVNEYGPPAFADLFFFVTGFHGSHVFSGVVLLLILLINVNKGTYERRGHYEMVEKIGLYWHFVDLVWVFVFTFFYLI
ncbi:MAG: hypothetical protein D6730_00475 [Bacteroidetes bacterium]|nr:MAG: hypothetical protein D6730_00475 [Bacteroidota bacterium]